MTGTETYRHKQTMGKVNTDRIKKKQGSTTLLAAVLLLNSSHTQTAGVKEHIKLVSVHAHIFPELPFSVSILLVGHALFRDGRCGLFRKARGRRILTLWTWGDDGGGSGGGGVGRQVISAGDPLPWKCRNAILDAAQHHLVLLVCIFKLFQVLGGLVELLTLLLDSDLEFPLWWVREERV